MDDATLKEFEKHYRDLSDVRIEAEMERWLPDSDRRQILVNIIAERRKAGKAAEKERFDKAYTQAERHHRDLKRSARIAAVISVLGALASWASVWYSRVQTSATPTAVRTLPVLPAAPPTSEEPHNPQPTAHELPASATPNDFIETFSA